MLRCFPERLLYPVNFLSQQLDLSSGLIQVWTKLSSQSNKTARREEGLHKPPASLCREGSMGDVPQQQLGPQDPGGPKLLHRGLGLLTSCMNFLQTGRISLLRVALNIMHCFSCGVRRKISCTSRRMSGWGGQETGGHECLPDLDLHPRPVPAPPNLAPR